MRTDPEPQVSVAFSPGQRPVLKADAHRPVVSHRLEMQGRMLRIAQPQAVIFQRQLPNFGWKCVQQAPEAGRGQRFQAGGSGEQLPARYSVKASSASASSLPALASREICSSHCWARYASNQRMNSASSCGLNCRTFSSINSTALMAETVPVGRSFVKADLRAGEMVVFSA